MCNNNGHCRKFDAGTMCPSYRATQNEQDLTRGRANTLRLAISGQLGDEGEEAAKAALDLCVSCKGCKRECPTGVDMARMKIEFLAHYKASHGHSLRDRAIAYLPRYAPWAGRLAPLANGAASLGRSLLGFSTERPLPKWRADFFQDRTPEPQASGREVVLFVDTFSRWFEPENVRAAIRVLEAAGCSVRTARPLTAGRPLCCGRHVPHRRHGRSGASRGAPHARRPATAPRARHPGHRTRALLPPFVPRRIRGAVQEIGRA